MSTPQTYAVVLDTGEPVLDKLREFASAEGISTSHFTAIGAFESVTLGYFDLDQTRYLEIPVEEQVEVLTMAGDMVGSGEDRRIHAHVVVGRRDGTTRGGHLLHAVTRPTLEVMVTESPAELARRYDETTGLTLIDPG
ncbi:PPC domain-containing DNA-binding protein [Phytoactinopolyspora halotolerans]|uniref:PPC domain-containing DNA-binding protein n=1 Tax=Phytoactinopolyspora halotolerans TaxID=1981512 RepID=UPI001C20AE7A|nr:PPC domain-containing DNA-binding protein [Phytoactinopolyspora halotolerans]